jgi:hypothetical protein
MPFPRVLLILLLSTSAALAQDKPPTLKTLDGQTLIGELTTITDKEIVLRVKGKDQSTPVQSVLRIDFQPLSATPFRDPNIAIELTDGSTFRCTKFSIKGKDATFTLTSGQEVGVPLAAINYILRDGQDQNLVKQFRESYLLKPRQTDFVLVRRGNALNGLDGTIGDGDAKGDTVEFIRGDTKRSVSLAKLQGLLFLREADPKMPPAACKLLDTAHNEVMVAHLGKTAAGFTIVTPSGAKMEYGRQLVASLDYSKGKLTFLADMNPSQVLETCTEGEGSVQHYRRNTNLDGGPIRLGKFTYTSGLALHARTELEYDLKGEYREFKALLGVEDAIGGGEGPTVVRILGDGKELFSITLRGGQKLNPAADKANKDNPAALPVTLSVRNVLKLRIIVASGELLDLGKHATLAEARVSK